MPLFQVLLVFAAVAPLAVNAQSTSRWVRVTPKTPATAVSGPANPKLGDSYLVAEFLGARVYQDSNWWTGMIESDRKALLTTTLEGELAGIQIKDARAAPPVEIKRNKAPLDISYSEIVVQRFPTTYKKLILTVQISKASKDGANELLNAVAEVSKTAPSMTISTSALGAITASKLLLDFLFQKKLIEQKVVSTMEFQDSGESLPAGYYASFAADSLNEYQGILDRQAKGEVYWDGAQLKQGNDAINRVSYFVVRVSYADRTVANATHILSFNKPWAALYKEARRKVDEMAKKEDLERISSEARAAVVNAHRLLDLDPDYVQSERDSFHDTIRQDINDKIKARLAQIDGGIFVLKLPAMLVQ